MADNPQTTPDRLVRMRQAHKEITESDGGECELMADYRWACDEIERLRAHVRFSTGGLASPQEIADRWNGRVVNVKV